MPLARVVVLGTGSIGTRHVRVFSSIPGVEVVAVPSRRPGRVGELASQGIAAAHDLASALPCDGLVIATNTGDHVGDLMAAVRHGVGAVLVEKPLALSCGRLRDVLDTLSSPGCKVFVGCCLRFDRGLLAFRESLPDLGRLHAVTIECRSYLPDWRPQRDYRESYSARREEGGVLRDLIHEIDYAMWLFGMPGEAFGWLGHSGTLDVESEDCASLFWVAPSGTAVSIGLDYLSKPALRRGVAYGASGTTTWDALRRTVCIQRQGSPARLVEVGGARDEMYLEQARAFLAAIRGEDAGPLATGLEGARAVAICDAVRRSSETRRREAIRLRGEHE